MKRCGRGGLMAAITRQVVNMMRSAAAERNKSAILEVLQTVVSADTQLNALEIASGLCLFFYQLLYVCGDVTCYVGLCVLYLTVR